MFLEAPRWRRDRLWVSDMFARKVYAVGTDRRRELVCDVPGRPSGLGFQADGTLLVVSMADRRLLKLVGGRLVDHADLSRLVEGDCNDMVVDARGGAFVGSFGYDLFGGAPARTASIVRVDPDGGARVVAEELAFPNGFLLKDAGRTLVVAETAGMRLAAFDVDPNGDLSRRRVYASLPGRAPDGICLDREGGIWVACFDSGEFVRVLEGGEVTDRVEVPGKRAAACQLGGQDGRTLYCLTYAGTMEDLKREVPGGAIGTVRVDVGGGGSP